MTLIVGLKCSDGIILTAEEEEILGFTAKRKVNKLKLYTDEHWALVFAGAGDGAIIDNAERQLSKWLDERGAFTGDELAEAIDTVLAAVYSKYIDPDPRAEGITLVIGTSCSDGLHLISTVKRTPQFQDSKTCTGYGADVAYYLLDRLYSSEDDWISGVKVAAFAAEEAKESSQFCGGDTHILVLQSPPSPRWRDLGWGGANELGTNSAYRALGALRNTILGVNFKPEICEEYSDEHHPEPYVFDPEKFKEERKRSASQELADQQ